MAGDAVMAALGENGSKHGVSAGNEEFLQRPWVVNSTTDNETSQCRLYIRQSSVHNTYLLGNTYHTMRHQSLAAQPEY